MIARLWPVVPVGGTGRPCQQFVRFFERIPVLSFEPVWQLIRLFAVYMTCHSDVLRAIVTLSDQFDAFAGAALALRSLHAGENFLYFNRVVLRTFHRAGKGPRDNVRDILLATGAGCGRLCQVEQVLTLGVDRMLLKPRVGQKIERTGAVTHCAFVR